MTPSKRVSFEVYLSNDGLRQVSNPVRIKILRLLREALSEGAELKDIYLYFERNGERKSKSTLFEHLRMLLDRKFIIEKPHPDDKRRRLFLLNAKYVGTTEIPLIEVTEQLSTIIRKSIGDPLRFSNGLFCAIRYGLEGFTSFNLNPILKEIGKTIGKQIVETITAESLDGVLNELSEFWDHHKLGHLEVVSNTPLTIVIKDCYECGMMPDVGKTLCAQDEGILEVIFESKFGKPYRIKEIECHGTGHPHCKFIVTVLLP
jgi:predicted hydrocarbon binding protein